MKIGYNVFLLHNGVHHVDAMSQSLAISTESVEHMENKATASAIHTCF